MTNGNDYAVAKALNECVTGIIIMIFIAHVAGAPEDYEIKELNRAYILLVDELQKLYDRNPKLAAIKPEPIWQIFDVLRTSTWEIGAYLKEENNDYGNAHTARVEKLCILSDVDDPKYTPEQKKLVDYAEEITKKYGKMLDATVLAEYRAKNENNWQIPEYILTYKPDGSILINDVLKLKKAHAGSTTERLLEQAVKHPGVLFKPDLGQTSRNLSTVLGSAGFTQELRDLFFPTVSKDKGIVFRPTITRKQADSDHIDTTMLDVMLKELGAITEPKMPN